jgi:type IV pilus assembly protein PilN
LIRINLLPKNLRKRVEPGWWRLIAITVPVAVLAVIAGLQLSANATRDQLIAERDQLQVEVTALDRYVQAQTQLNQQQKELETTTGIKAQLERERVRWSQEIRAFISKIPRRNDGTGGAIVSIKSLALKRVDAGTATTLAQSGAYDGKLVSTEFSLQGETTSEADISRFTRAFDSDPGFGVQFQNYSRSGDALTQRFTFSAIVGIVNPNQPPPTPPAAPPVAPGTPPAATPPAGGN